MVPASQRADGSTRKPIRIRQGYVPQDETPKYKTVAQRRREREAKRAAEGKSEGESAVDELQMDKLSLEQKKETPLARERPRTAGDRQEDGRREPVEETKAAAAGEKVEGQQQLKRQLTKINKQLKEIAKLEVEAEAPTLSPQQMQKIGRKATLQLQRNEIIAELNGATVTRSCSSKSGGPRPKVAISL